MSRTPDERDLPPLVTASLTADVRSYWLKRAAQHTQDSYAGVRMSKFPEDLRTYEHLLWASRANVVVELGAQFGGSALWFRDRLMALAHYGRIQLPRVISIDIDTRAVHFELSRADPGYEELITVVESDVTDEALPARVSSLIPAGSRCLVVEDSAHVFDTTFAALRGFAHLVPLDGYFVVEDGCVDIEDMRLSDDWPRGVLPALHQWLETPGGRQFRVREDLQLYGLSCHPHGFLQRVRQRP